MRPTSCRSQFGPAFARLVVILTSLGVAWVEGLAFDAASPRLAAVLKQHVKDARVDYAGLRARPADLNAYLDEAAAVSRPEFKAWNPADQLAFLCNVYNAATLRLIVDHYPVASIKDIGTLLKGPWDQPVVRLFGEVWTLDHLEHRVIRPGYAEPRIHVALVCAANGCPPLRAEPYVGARLDQQLADQARAFLADATKNRVVAAERTVYLSPIFDWYRRDFEQASGSVLAALAPYWPEGTEAPGPSDGFRIRYTDYDWSLNRQAK